MTTQALAVRLPWENPWDMAGTEGTHKYVVPAATQLARVGFRIFTDWDNRQKVRIRVEPNPTDEAFAAAVKRLAKFFPDSEGWKQPGHQPRFSHVFADANEALAVVEMVLERLRKRDPIVRQPGKRLWRKQLRELAASQPAQFPPPNEEIVDAELIFANEEIGEGEL
jgi:hypothetical protein